MDANNSLDTGAPATLVGPANLTLEVTVARAVAVHTCRHKHSPDIGEPATLVGPADPYP
jgi:hypothetical protein